ncbi:hypothetical protein BG015_001168, partial [Linnemannia schmuckeri]
MTNSVLDPVKYEEYGPLRMDSFFALTYGIGSAGLTATLTHVALYRGKEMLDRWRAAIVLKVVRDAVPGLAGNVNFLCREMELLSLVLPLGVTHHRLHLCAPRWDRPSRDQPTTRAQRDYRVRDWIPDAGSSDANVTFKAYGYITNVQALQFTQDLKLGQYTKIPLMTMFWVQVISSVIAGIINLATTEWLLRVQLNICTKAGCSWTCRNTSRAIGPGRMFGLGTQYSIIQWALVIAAFLPLPVRWLCRRHPRVKWLKMIHFPVLLAATSNMPPAQ